MEQEPEIGIFLYVVPERNLPRFSATAFFETTADIYIGLASQFLQSFADMDVIEAASGQDHEDVGYCMTALQVRRDLSA